MFALPNCCLVLDLTGSLPGNSTKVDVCQCNVKEAGTAQPLPDIGSKMICDSE